MAKIVKLSELNKKEREKLLEQTKKEVAERKAQIESEISFVSKNNSNNNIKLPTAKTTMLPTNNIKSTFGPVQTQQSGINRNVKSNTKTSIRNLANNVVEHKKEKEEKNKFVNKSGLSTIGSDAKIIGSNLLNSAHAGALQFAKTVNMRLDEAENSRRETDKKLLETAIKYREEDGEDVSELKSVLNSDRYKAVDSKPNYQEKIEKINTKMAENTEKASNVFSKKIAELSQGLGNNALGAGITAINPIAGTTYFIGSATGSYYDEAVQKGMNEDDAKLYARIMGGMEGAIEALLSGQNIKGFKSILKGQTAKDALKAFGIEIGENFIQEAVMEPLSELTTKVTGGDQFLKNDYRTVDGWKKLLSDSFSSGVDGALSVILLNGATKGVASATRVVNKLNSGTKPTQVEIQTAIKDSKEAGVNVEQVLQEQLIKSAEKKILQPNNILKEQALKEINESNVDVNTKQEMLEALGNLQEVSDRDMEAIRAVIKTSETVSNKLNTEANFKYDKDRRQKYIKYKNDTSGFDASEINQVLDIIPTNRNGKRTVKQWLKVADEIGQRIANKSNAEIEEIAYKSWFDIQPSKAITQYDNVAKKQVGFQKFTSDEWINTINNAVNKARETNTNINQNNNQRTNEIKLPMQKYQYQKSDNIKIDNLRQDASRYFNNSEKANNYVKMLEKIIEDKDIDIRLDGNLKTADGRIANGSYANGVITINPNSTRAGEFIAIHELTHAIGTEQMKKMIQTYRDSNLEFNAAVEKLLENYNTNEINEEALSDISGQLFGNQEFINSLVQNNPNLFQRIYNEIKYLWHQFVGYKNQDQFINDLKYKWEQAYRSNRINKNNNYSIQTNSNGKRYIKVDTDQNIFEGIKEGDYPKIAKMYMQDYLKGNTSLGVNDTAVIGNKGINKYTNPKQQTKYINEKMQLTPELKNVLEVAEKVDQSNPTKDTSKYPNWEYYKFEFELGGKTFEGLINIGIDKNNNKHFYEINKIHTTSNSYVSTNKSSSTDSINNSIPSSNENVNTTKYSIQESGNYAQDNQGRELSKEQQEYFKDSKVRDENGNLLEVYHGTKTKGINIFNYDPNRQTGTNYGKAYYFTTDYIKAQGYQYDINKDPKFIEYDKIGKEYLDKVFATSDENEKKKIVQEWAEWEKENSATKLLDDENFTPERLPDGETKKLYLNIKNPYIADAKGQYYFKVYDEYFKEARANGNDGIIVKNVIDVAMGKHRPIDVYIAFNENQIKNVDNTNPTSNDDIRYSLPTKGWQRYLDENYKPTGTRTNLKEITSPNKDTVVLPTKETTTQNIVMPTKKKTLNPTEISNLTSDAADTTPVLPIKNYKRGNKESSFLSNITTDAGFLNEDLRHEMAKEDNIRYYKGITNQETLEKAYNSLNKDGKNATLNWFNKESKNVTAEDVAKGWILLKQYQDAGDYQSAVEVAKKMREMGTSAGQATQAYNILSRLTPEGMFFYAQSELTEAYNQMVKGKSKEWIDKNASKFDLTAEETQIIMDTMQDVSTMEDGYEKKVKIAEIQKLITDKIPPTAGQSIKAWMRISMLFNTKTQVRNILGNAVILPVNVTSDFISSGIDKVISKKTGVRTTGNINLKKYGTGFKKGLFESYNDFRKGINTRNIEGNRFEVTEGKSFKNKGLGKALNRVDSLLSFMLDAGDRGFYESTFTNSINNQLVLNNTTEVTQEMIDIATNEALQRTWQDNNKYTESVLKIRKILNAANIKGYGLGDVLIPFAKTPANLTKAIVDYSPVGLIKTVALDAKTFKNSLQNGQFTPQLQHKFVQDIGKGMAGSFLYVLGYALAKAGIASGEADDDKDVKNFMKNSLGISSYSIKVGNKTFTYDWAQPVATPLAIMTNYVKYSKDNPDANIIEKAIKSLNIGTEQLLQQSFMDSLNTVLNGSGTTLENLTQAVLELPARAIPTFSKQVADMIDGTQRTSFEYDKPLKSAINSITAKVPFASKTLPVSRDTLGNEIKKYGGENNIFNVMFNPANVNKGELSKAGEEIYRLYQETGETSVFPITAPYYINSKGEKITMTAEERSNYQKVTGEYTEKAINELISNSSYKKLTDEKKAELIKEIISDSNAKAKYDILKIETDDAKKKRELIEKAGTKSYYDYKFRTKDLEKEIEKVEVLANANYSNKIKETIYESTIGKDDSLYSIMKESNIDTTEYLKYKSQKFESNKKDDGTTTGKTISGSKKNKVVEYVSDMNIKYEQKLLLLGTQYSLTSQEKTKLAHYINDMNISKKRKMEIYDKISGFTVYKDGRIKW